MGIKKIDIFRFYYYWFDIEIEMYNDIVKENNPVIGLYNYLNYMRVIRNFKKGKIEDVYNIVKNYKNNASSEMIYKLSDDLKNSNLLSGITKKVYVAASKILWLYNRKLVIMDNNNINVLKKLGYNVSNYENYTISWETLFKENRQDIINLNIHYNLNNIDKVVEEEWFQRRVFDMYLWKEFKNY